MLSASQAGRTSSIRERWYEKMLPFVAKGPEGRVRWLIKAFADGVLLDRDITPYIRLLLMAEPQDIEKLRTLFEQLDGDILVRMLKAADVYETATLFSLLPAPTEEQALIALRKECPPYEQAPQQTWHRIYHAIHSRAPQLLINAADRLLASVDSPAHFRETYAQFQEVLADQEVLLVLYPKVKKQAT